jgi:hypothetical protein
VFEKYWTKIIVNLFFNELILNYSKKSDFETIFSFKKPKKLQE